MRVLAVNDISCVGKCSLTVTLPIISASGVTCDILPTAILSTHTGGFTGYTFRDLSEDIPAMLAHWKSLNLKYDFIVSGYLGSIEQIDMVKSIKRDFLKEGGVMIVDPVMGEGGKLYAHFDMNFAKEMRRLCEEADYILPNVTEACLLADVPYPENDRLLPVGKIVEKLRSSHTCPMITGVVEGTENAVYYDDGGKISRFAVPNADGVFHGSGDVFAAAFTGCLARGKDVGTSVALASEFTTNAIFRTAKAGDDRRYGIRFEEEIFSFLRKLNA